MAPPTKKKRKVNDDDDDDVNENEEKSLPITKKRKVNEGCVDEKKSLKFTVWKLFDEGHTIPFLARYRKKATGGLDPDALRHLHEEYELKKDVEMRGKKLLTKLEKSGQCNQEARNSILSAESIDDIETLTAQYKSSSVQTLATRAKAMPGIESLALSCIEGVSIRKGLSAEEKLNVGYVIAEVLLKKAEIRELLKAFSQDSRLQIHSKQAKAGKKTCSGTTNSKSFQLYFDFKASLKSIKSHQILAINRGEKKKELKVTIETPDSIFLPKLVSTCLHGIKYPENNEMIKEAISEAYKRLVKPSLKRRARSYLSKKAESEAVDVFADNLRQLLLTPPCRNSIVMGLDPGFKHGCKMAIIDSQGQVLQTGVVFPQVGGTFSASDQKFLLEAIDKWKVDIIGIGNRSGFAHTEKSVAHLIGKSTRKVAFTSVNEDGASIFSCSEAASAEFPGMDPNLISAVSIARRLQDPLAEYVKIGPSHLGVGMYQHDVAETRLRKTLEAIVTECVSFVGVDLNKAPAHLLRYVSGINAGTAKNIVHWRSQHGEFSSRSDLLKVKGLGDKAFEQCAGFVRIPHGSNPLDATLIHPEAYSLAEKILTSLGFSSENVGQPELIKKVKADRKAFKMEEQREEDKEKVELIIEALKTDLFRDYRDDMDGGGVLLKTEIVSIDSLRRGQVLDGCVKNVTHFGAFVDIGVGRDGLLHSSQIGGRQEIKLGQRLKVSIRSIDNDRISLALAR